MAEIRERPSWSERDTPGMQTNQFSGKTLNSSDLSTQLNAYTISDGPTKRITVPGASRLAQLQEISITGSLLPKQFIAIDPRTNKRTVSADPNGYTINPNDGDLHLDIGPARLQPHITCELQSATKFLSTFKSAVGQQITINGFFRCLFEHPGFGAGDDGHIFEIHPVTQATGAGKTLSFEIGIPDQKSIHTWTNPHPLNVQDKKIQVSYDQTRDTLTFSGMDGSDENYVKVGGTISQVQPNNTAGPATFVLSSPEIGHEVRVLCLQTSKARKQLIALRGSKVSMVGLRNIDLAEALKGQYTINLLGIDIQAA